MGTKINPGKFDCYAKAAPDEPMFVLLGRDKHAPTLVWLWATLRELDGEDPEKVAEARQCVADMMLYQAERGYAAVGLGQAALAGCLELVMAANMGVENAKNEMTTVDEMRRFLAKTRFAPEDAP